MTLMREINLREVTPKYEEAQKRLSFGAQHTKTFFPPPALVQTGWQPVSDSSLLLPSSAKHF